MNPRAAMSLAPLLLIQAQGQELPPHNDLVLTNGGDYIAVFSTPSVGGPTETPALAGDLYWRAHRGDEVMRSEHPLLGAEIEISGYYERIYDTDWTTSPHFYTRAHTSARESLLNPGNLEPSFFQLGYLDGPVVVVGPSGFGNPCTISPSLASPSGSSCCPPPGFINGYIVELRFGQPGYPPIAVPSDGTPLSDTATTYFVRGGMTYSGGSCGLGDYVMQDVHSDDETIPDVTGAGISPNTGHQLAGSGPITDPWNETLDQQEAFSTPILNVIADSGGGLGIEGGSNFGGARNGQYLDVASGTATLGVEIRDLAGAAEHNLGIAAASFSTLPSPGATVLGAQLLIAPDSLASATSAVWQGPVKSDYFLFTPEGVFQGAQVPVPAGAAGATIYTQGVTISLTTLQGRSTNVFRTRFF